MKNRNALHRAAGFTLIELMVTVVIASVLFAIAVPAYTSYVRKSRRTEAKTALVALAGLEERFYSTNNAYSQTTTDLGYTGAFPVSVGSGYYTVTVTAITPATAAAAATYQLDAVPVGDQLKDTACATFTLQSNGVQKATANGGADNTATCWR